MYILIDLTLLAILVFTIWRSSRRGFVRSVIELVGWFAAIMLATWLAGMMASAVYTSFIEPELIKGVQNTLTGISQSAGADVSTIYDSLPFFLRGAFSEGELMSEINNGLSQGSASAATAVAESLKPVFVSIVSTILSVLLAIPFMILVRIAAKQINKLFNLPIVGVVNRVLGGILGFFKGILIIFIFVIIIDALMRMSSGGSVLFFTPAAIDHTVLYKMLSSLNPLN